MASVTFIYGDEEALMEECKQKAVKAHGDLPITVVTAEKGAGEVLALLREDSLFGDHRIIYGVDWPIFQAKGKSLSDQWAAVRDVLLQYGGANPVVLMYHGMIDGKASSNKVLLGGMDVHCFEKMSAQDMFKWAQQYCKARRVTIEGPAMAYLQHLFGLWKDVPLSFLKTELDRLFLLLGEEKKISEEFLKEHMSDFGAKNIFAFMDALFAKDAAVLLHLFPFILSYKESEQALSYIEGQLQLQLMVMDCRASGFKEQEIVSYFDKHKMRIHPYRVKLAYNKCMQLSRTALEELLKGLYDSMLATRRGQGSLLAFQDLCLAYCKRGD